MMGNVTSSSSPVASLYCTFGIKGNILSTLTILRMLVSLDKARYKYFPTNIVLSIHPKSIDIFLECLSHSWVYFTLTISNSTIEETIELR